MNILPRGGREASPGANGESLPPPLPPCVDALD